VVVGRGRLSLGYVRRSASGSRPQRDGPYATRRWERGGIADGPRSIRADRLRPPLRNALVPSSGSRSIELAGRSRRSFESRGEDAQCNRGSASCSTVARDPRTNADEREQSDVQQNERNEQLDQREAGAGRPPISPATRVALITVFDAIDHLEPPSLASKRAR